MSQQNPRRPSAEEMEKIAIEFENRDFTPEELVKIAATRRSTPGLTRAAASRSGTGDE